MGKRIHEWLRQRRVAVMYGVLWCSSLCVIAVFFHKTLTDIAHRADGEIAEACVVMYVISIVLSVPCVFFGLSIRQGKRRLCVTMQLLAFVILVTIFRSVFDVLGGEGLAFSIGAPASGFASVYEAFFIWALFMVGAGFQITLISNEARRPEMNMLHGGILIIVGILLPKMLDSYSLLRAYCYEVQCGNGELGSVMLFEMAIAYAAALAAMFVFGVFSPSIRTSIRKCTGESESEGLTRSEVVSHHCDRPVSSRAEKESFDKSTLAGSSTGLSGVALSKQLMSVAVAGLVAGACFSVVNRLFSRR